MVGVIAQKSQDKIDHENTPKTGQVLTLTLRVRTCWLNASVPACLTIRKYLANFSLYRSMMVCDSESEIE